MSARVRAGSQQPARGGDGRRRRWSESPIPRVATRRVRSLGVAPVPLEFYVDASLASDFVVSEFDVGGYFVCELVLISGPTVTYSDPFYPPEGTIPAHEQLSYAFDFTSQYGGPWDYARIRWHYGDGSATYYVFDGEYGPPGTALEQDGTYPARLIDPEGLITQ